MQLNHKGTLKEIQQLFEELEEIALQTQVVGDQPLEQVKPQKKTKLNNPLLLVLDSSSTITNNNNTTPITVSNHPSSSSSTLTPSSPSNVSHLSAGPPSSPTLSSLHHNQRRDSIMPSSSPDFSGVLGGAGNSLSKASGGRVSSVRALPIGRMMMRHMAVLWSHKLAPFQERLDHIFDTLSSVELFYTRCSWAQIFYHRMLHSKNVVSDKTMLSYVELLGDYLDLLSLERKPETARRKSNAESFLEFLETHLMDPDSSLVGLPPSKDLVSKFLANEANNLGDQLEIVKRGGGGGLFANKKRGYALSHNGVFMCKGDVIIARISKVSGVATGGGGSGLVARSPPNSPLSSPPGSPPKNSGSGFDLFRQRKQEQQQQQSGGTSPPSSSPPQSTTLTSSLSPVTLSAPTHVTAVVYCRLATEQIENGTVLVYTSSDESLSQRVSTSSVLPLPPEFRQLLGSAKTMQTLVQDSVDDFYHMMHTYIDEQILFFFDRADLAESPALFRKCSSNRATLGDLAQVRKLRDGLAKMLNERDERLVKFLESIENFTKEKIGEFVVRSQGGQPFGLHFFLPRKDISIQQLKEFPFGEFAKNRLQSYVGVFDSALDQLQLQRKEMLFGTTKRKLTEWWLMFIDHRAERLLKSKNYNFSAVPEDYIEKAPSSIEAVKSNLQIVQSIINPSSSSSSSVSDSSSVLQTQQLVQRTIAQVRENVYPKIDAFIVHALITLQEHFKLPVDPSPSYDLSRIEELVKEQSKSGQLDSNQALQIIGLCKDVAYLREMKKLEELMDQQAQSPGTTQLALTHVVPVSGLFMSCFYRLENELKTVIELWSGDPNDFATTERRKAIQNAIPTTDTPPGSADIATGTSGGNLTLGSGAGGAGSATARPYPVKGSRIGIGNSGKFRRRRVNTDKAATLNMLGIQRVRVVSAMGPSQTSLRKEEEADDLDEDPAPPENITKSVLPVIVPNITPTTLREVAASEQPLVGLSSLTPKSRSPTLVCGLQPPSPTMVAKMRRLELQQQEEEKKKKKDYGGSEDENENENENGMVVRKYANGDVYEGQFLNGKRHGKGEYRFSTGDVYDGQHERGSFKGVGIYRYANGDHYSGQFVAGVFEGQGVFTTSNFKYMGQFVKDKMCGRGIMVYTDGDRYVGEFKDDMKHGKGTYTSVDGSRYDGNWEEDVRHGWGVLLTAEGLRKEGLWQFGSLVSEEPVSSSSPSPSSSSSS